MTTADAIVLGLLVNLCHFNLKKYFNDVITSDKSINTGCTYKKERLIVTFHLSQACECAELRREARLFSYAVITLTYHS